MRKKTLLILTAVITLSMSMFVGCGNQQEVNNNITEQPTTTEAPTSTPTEAPTPTPTETPTPTPTEPPHEHAYTEAITTEATCEVDGVKTFTCDCGDTYTEAIKATGHNYKDETKAPTCTEKGYTTHTCKTCGSAYTDTEVPANGHSYGKYTYNNDATREKDGTETATCSACGKKNTRTKEGTKLLYDGYDEFGNGFVYGTKTEYDRMGNKVKQKIFEANNPYTLYQVVDGGGTNIYFYFIFTGSANKGPEYNACYDEGIAILFARYPEKTVQMAQGEYIGTYNGQVIYKALPITGAIGPDGRPVW